MTSVRGRFRGFTLPLTLALAFSIMAVAAGLTGMVTVRARAARQQDNDVFARITLESAIQGALAGLEKDGVPQTDRWPAAYSLNGRTVRLTFMAVDYDIDVNEDPPETVLAAIPGKALQARLGQVLAPAGDPPVRPHFARTRDLIAALGANPREEDCLRGLITLDRRTVTPAARPERSALLPKSEELNPGQVLIVRASLDSSRYQDVLWEKVRYSGRKGAAWHIHDWRMLRLAPGAQLCPPPAAEPAPAIRATAR